MPYANNPYYEAYPTKDGKTIFIAGIDFWGPFFRFIGWPGSGSWTKNEAGLRNALMTFSEAFKARCVALRIAEAASPI